MKKFVIIVAAGSGARMENPVPKQFLLLCGKPVISHTIVAFEQSFDDIQIIVVLSGEQLHRANDILRSAERPGNITIIQGGETRVESVRNGIQNIDDGNIIFVHDGVRCLVTSELIKRCYDHACMLGNAVPSITATDSIRIKTNGSNQSIPRDHVYQIQTPQTFKSEILKQAFEQPIDQLFTDEATMVERLGIPINLVPGETTNIKITTPIDLLTAEKILKMRSGNDR